MLVRGVVDHEIDDHADAALPAAMGELDEIAERAVARIDAVIVGDVVAVVPARRGLERHQPDRGDAEAMQIVEPAQQALEIADAVAVGVHVGADGEAIENAFLYQRSLIMPGFPFASYQVAAPGWVPAGPLKASVGRTRRWRTKRESASVVTAWNRAPAT